MRNENIRIEEKEVGVLSTETLIDRFIGMRGRSEGKMFFDFSVERRWRLDNAFVICDLYLYFFDAEKKLVEYGKIQKGGLNPLNWSFYRPEKPFKYLLESDEELEIEYDSKLRI